MKVYDCFMFSDEKMLLDIRLNYLNKFVDKFLIVESKYLHNGMEKKLNFNINEFYNFKNKIEYFVIDKHPEGILNFNEKDSSLEKDKKKIINSLLRENFQRNQLNKMLSGLNPNDLILISDLDEIPDIRSIDFKEINNEILIFKQKMFYYKFNLLYENFIWFGTKAVKKKNFVSAQWLRNVKNKIYPFWRLDTYFSKKKYSNIKFIENGGWHFTCIKKPKDIHKKLLTFLHHQDYEKSNITEEELERKITEKKILYDHSSDKKNKNKWFSDKTLKKVDLNILPDVIINQKKRYKEWID